MVAQKFDVLYRRGCVFVAPSNEMERLEQQALQNVEQQLEAEQPDQSVETTKKPDKGKQIFKLLYSSLACLTIKVIRATQSRLIIHGVLVLDFNNGSCLPTNTS